MIVKGQNQQDSCSPLSGGFDPTHFRQLAKIEGEHFWFTSRRRLISEIVANIVANLAPGYRALEIGCGTGNILSALKQVCDRGNVFGCDRYVEGLQWASSRGVSTVVQADACCLPFAVQFDVIGAFDVIEHIPNDVDTLTQLYQMVTPGGKLVVTVPAYQWLWSDFDETAHHCRRYSCRELKEKLRNAGFEESFVSPFMMPLLPIMALRRSRLRRRNVSSAGAASSDDLRIVPIVNDIFRALLSIERPVVARGIPLPFGTSILAVAVKSVSRATAK